jgi:amidase
MPYPSGAGAARAHRPLAGLSFGVKDLFDVPATPPAAASPCAGAVGHQDRTAPTVQKLLDAGARFVGQDHHRRAGLLDERPERALRLARQRCGARPHHRRLVVGLGGAVSHRLCDFALGTDTGGSVRAPASHCGLVGLRPTHGRVSLQDALDLSPSLDTCGWFTRDVPTFARVADVLLGEDASRCPPTVRLLRPPTCGRCWRPSRRQGPGPARRGRAGAGQGPADHGGAGQPRRDVLALPPHPGHRGLAGGRRLHPPLRAAAGPGRGQRFAWSAQVTDAQVAEGQAFRAASAPTWQAAGHDGVLLMPTMPDIAPLVSDPTKPALEDYRNRAIRLLCVAGLAGFPQLSLPLATRAGAPLGMSLLGRPAATAAWWRWPRCVWPTGMSTDLGPAQGQRPGGHRDAQAPGRAGAVAGGQPGPHAAAAARCVLGLPG